MPWVPIVLIGLAIGVLALSSSGTAQDARPDRPAAPRPLSEAERSRAPFVHSHLHQQVVPALTRWSTRGCRMIWLPTIEAMQLHASEVTTPVYRPMMRVLMLGSPVFAYRYQTPSGEVGTAIVRYHDGAYELEYAAGAGHVPPSSAAMACLEQFARHLSGEDTSYGRVRHAHMR